MAKEKKYYKYDLGGLFMVRAMALGCNTSGVYHMSGKCWIMSTKDIKCDSFFDSMEDDFHKYVKSVICKDKRFSRNMIIVFDVSRKKMRPMERRFLKFDVYFRERVPSMHISSAMDLIIGGISKITDSMASRMEDNGFIVNNSKKELFKLISDEDNKINRGRLG